MPIERKLAAIMFTDIAGYTAQMSKDEDKAFALIQKKTGSGYISKSRRRRTLRCVRARILLPSLYIRDVLESST